MICLYQLAGFTLKEKLSAIDSVSSPAYEVFSVHG